MYNVSTDKCNYFFNYNNDYQVNLLAEINLINNLHDDFELPWSKFFVATCNNQFFVIFVVLLVLKIEKNRKFTYSDGKNDFIFYLFAENRR